MTSALSQNQWTRLKISGVPHSFSDVQQLSYYLSTRQDGNVCCVKQDSKLTSMISLRMSFACLPSVAEWCSPGLPDFLHILSAV